MSTQPKHVEQNRFNYHSKTIVFNSFVIISGYFNETFLENSTLRNFKTLRQIKVFIIFLL